MFEFGFYEKEITPPLGSGIPGYFNARRGCDVLDKLYVRAVVIKSGEEKIAILSMDALYPVASNDIAERITEYTGIPRENIMIAATHSHTALPIQFGGMDFEDENSTKGYRDVFIRLAADCVTLANLRLQKASPYLGIGEVNGISFCRDYYMKNGTPQTNPPRGSAEIIKSVTEPDTELPVLMIKGETNTPIGAIISFACHLDCVSGEKLSGDYVSVLAKELKKKYGEDFVTVFLLGCCGDVNHFDVSKKEDASDHYVQMGKKIAQEVIATAEIASELKKTEIRSQLEYIPIPRIAVEKEIVDDARNAIATIKQKKGVKISADNTDPDQYKLALSKLLVNFLDSTPETIQAPVQCIQIGEFTIYGFNSEVFTEFGKIVKKGDGTGSNLVASLCNEAFGYVPTRDLFYDTIYESLPGSCHLDKEAGYIMAEKLISMKQ